MNITTPSILVVDDEPDNYDVIEVLLGNNEDYQLQYAASGKDALTSLDSFSPDLILLDVMMPELDGIEVCQRIKSKPKWQSIPIIMVTALTAKEALSRCLESGADDFISKPINSLELRARVKSMLRIKNQYDDLQTLLKLREDMVSMVVHDLRSPLTGILMSLNQINNFDYPKEQQKKKLAEIFTSAQALDILIGDLLKIAQHDSSQINLNRTDVDLRNLIKSVTTDFDLIAAQKNQTLVTQLPEEASRKSSVDIAMMKQTLGNLISNAIKFSPRYSSILINLQTLSSGGAKIQVIDYGPGFPEALKNSIFEKQESERSDSNVSKIGLGLAFCKLVIDAHGGDISVKNNQPQGSIFEINLVP